MISAIICSLAFTSGAKMTLPRPRKSSNAAAMPVMIEVDPTRVAGLKYKLLCPRTAERESSLHAICKSRANLVKPALACRSALVLRLRFDKEWHKQSVFKLMVESRSQARRPIAVASRRDCANHPSRKCDSGTSDNPYHLLKSPSAARASVIKTLQSSPRRTALKACILYPPTTTTTPLLGSAAI